jgi:hypothetical protein
MSASLTMLSARKGLATPAGGASPNIRRLSNKERGFIDKISRAGQAQFLRLAVEAARVFLLNNLTRIPRGLSRGNCAIARLKKYGKVICT